jgi:transposase-like protein
MWPSVAMIRVSPVVTKMVGCPLCLSREVLTVAKCVVHDGMLVNMQCETCGSTWTELTRRKQHEPMPIPPMSPVSSEHKP